MASKADLMCRVLCFERRRLFGTLFFRRTVPWAVLFTALPQSPLPLGGGGGKVTLCRGLWLPHGSRRLPFVVDHSRPFPVSDRQQRWAIVGREADDRRPAVCHPAWEIVYR